MTNEHLSSSPVAILASIRQHADLSLIYHRKRERFFELLDKGSKITSLALGSAALAKVASQGTIEAFTALMTFLSASSLVFSFAERARRHNDLCRPYSELLTEIEGSDENKVEPEKVYGWSGQLRSIEMKEPPTLSLLVVACQNELARAEGRDHDYVPLGVCRTLFMHFFDLPAPRTAKTRWQKLFNDTYDVRMLAAIIFFAWIIFGNGAAWIGTKLSSLPTAV